MIVIRDKTSLLSTVNYVPNVLIKFNDGISCPVDSVRKRSLLRSSKKTAFMRLVQMN